MKTTLHLSILALAVSSFVAPVYAQDNPSTPLIGVVGAIEIPDINNGEYYSVRLLNAVNTSNATVTINTSADMVADMDFLKKRVARYISNNFTLQFQEGAIIQPEPKSILIKKDWLLENAIEPGSIIVVDETTDVAIFNGSGDITFAVFSNDKDVIYSDVTIKTTQGRMINCTSNSAGCDTEVYALINAERFELTPGQTAEPKHPLISAISILKAEREQVPVPNPWEHIEFIVSFKPEYVPENTSGPFPDVPFKHPYREAISHVKNEEIVSGYTDGTFKPEKTLNRAEFTKMVISASDNTEYNNACNGYPGELALFPDTVYQSWYGPFVCVAKYRGLIEGYPDGKFKPERTISFAESAKIISIEMNLPLNQAKNQQWYEPYVAALEERNAIPPSIASLEQQITRAELAYILFKISSNT